MARLTSAKSTVLCAMCTALTVLFVYMAAIVPTMRAAIYFLSSFIVYVLVCEKIYGGAILSYIASSVICFLIVPNKLALLPYVCLLGHFGIFKVFIDRKVKDRFIGFMIKLIYCNVFAALAIVLVMNVFNVEDFIVGINIAPWIIAIVAQVVFIVFNTVYTLCQQFYDTRLRSLIVPKR